MRPRSHSCGARWSGPACSNIIPPGLRSISELTVRPANPNAAYHCPYAYTPCCRSGVEANESSPLSALRKVELSAPPAPDLRLGGHAAWVGRAAIALATTRLNTAGDELSVRSLQLRAALASARPPVNWQTTTADSVLFGTSQVHSSRTYRLRLFTFFGSARGYAARDKTTRRNSLSPKLTSRRSPAKVLISRVTYVGACRCSGRSASADACFRNSA